MKHKIENEYDYMIALSEREADHARSLLGETRGTGDYWREKAAAKIAEFCEANEKLIRRFAELKLYHPEAGAAMEAKWPHLRSLSDAARAAFDEHRSKTGQ